MFPRLVWQARSLPSCPMRPMLFTAEVARLKAALVEECLSGTSVAVARARLGSRVEAADPSRAGTACARVQTPLVGLYTSIP